METPTFNLLSLTDCGTSQPQRKGSHSRQSDDTVLSSSTVGGIPVDLMLQQPALPISHTYACHWIAELPVERYLGMIV